MRVVYTEEAIENLRAFGSPLPSGEVGANGSRECAPDDRLRAG
jgi:hypothetical protein